MLDTFNTTIWTNDMDVSAYDYTYSTYQGTVDPRLDWTVGRRGVPYLDWADPGYSPSNTYYSSYQVPIRVSDGSMKGSFADLILL